jgi:hypothetical protein
MRRPGSAGWVPIHRTRRTSQSSTSIISVVFIRPALSSCLPTVPCIWSSRRSTSLSTKPYARVQQAMWWGSTDAYRPRRRALASADRVFSPHNSPVSEELGPRAAERKLRRLQSRHTACRKVDPVGGSPGMWATRGSGECVVQCLTGGIVGEHGFRSKQRAALPLGRSSTPQTREPFNATLVHTRQARVGFQDRLRTIVPIGPAKQAHRVRLLHDLPSVLVWVVSVTCSWLRNAPAEAAKGIDASASELVTESVLHHARDIP